MTDALGNGFSPLLHTEHLSMTEVLRNRFPLFLNEKTLRSAIESVCADFGKVKYLKILPAMRGAHLRCVCSLRLDSAAAEAALKSRLQVMEYAGEIHFLADVDERWTGRTL